MNASVLTIRGRVESRWVRGGGDGTRESVAASAAALVKLRVRVPTGVGATVRVPLAERNVDGVEIHAATAARWESRMIWPRSGAFGADEQDEEAAAGALVVTGVDGDGVLVAVPSGVHEFVVSERSGS